MNVVLPAMLLDAVHEMEIGPIKKRYSEKHIIGFLREADAGLPVKELCRKHGFSEPSTTVGRPSSAA